MKLSVDRQLDSLRNNGTKTDYREKIIVRRETLDDAGGSSERFVLQLVPALNVTTSEALKPVESSVLIDLVGHRPGDKTDESLTAQNCFTL